MKQNEKLLLGLLVLEFLLSCAWGLPQVVNAEIPQQVAEKARNATLLIVTRETDDGIRIGSGFFIEPDKIVTNIHVVAGAASISVAGKDGTESFAYSIEGPIRSIPTYDVVILQVSGERRGKPLSLGKGKKGDLIFASGYPAGKYNVTKGTIHSIQSDGQLRLTAKDFPNNEHSVLSPGNSGGPVLNLKGEVVGIAVSSADSAISYAVPSDKLNVLLSGPVQPFDEWLQGDVIRAYTFFRQGRKRYKQESYNEAIKELDNAIKLYPDFTAAYNERGKSKLSLAELKMDREETENARKYFNKAISDFDIVNEFIPDGIQVFHNRGLAKFKLGKLAVTPGEKQAQYNAAISDFDELLKLNPDDTDACLQRALVQFLLGTLASTPGEKKERYNAAISDYSKAIEQEVPDNGQAYVRRGIAKFFLGGLAGNAKTAWSLYDEIAKDLTKAFEIDPDSVNAFVLNPGNAGGYYIQGVVEFLRGQSKANYGHTEESRKHYNTAIGNFSKAIEHGANNAKVYLYRSKVYSRIGQQKKAEADFRKAKQLDPNTEG